MTKEERHSIILELLMQHNSILVTELAEHLNVSSVTIRKDLTDLEKEKKLYRNHGKAILINPYINDRNVNEKEKFYTEEKRLIGMQAASLITKKDSILIASGTTMHALARCIQTTDKLTVITASLQVAIILSKDHNIDIIGSDPSRNDTHPLSTIGPGHGHELAIGRPTLRRIEISGHLRHPARISDQNDRIGQLFGPQMQMKHRTVIIDNQL